MLYLGGRWIRKTYRRELPYEYEAYDELYADDFTINGAGDIASVNLVNGSFLNFTPSAENTGSFIWSFEYTATNSSKQFNIYPLTSGSWEEQGRLISFA